MQFKLKVLFVFVLLSIICLLCTIVTSRKTCQPAAQQRFARSGTSTQQLTKEGVFETCETVHIAFVVAGTDAVRSFIVVLKSLMFHRHCPLHIHFISDGIAQSSLSVLLNTWSLPFFKYTFYSTEAIKSMISWIPNGHYSGIFGLMKLTLPYVLNHTDKVIVMDTDITIVSDVTDLWKIFKQLIEEQKIIGLVENQSDWYLGTLWKDHNPWPAIGRGFNTGIMLMNLKEMRKFGWSETWRIITKDTLPSHKYTSLADQDIINTVIKWNPSIVYRLPCIWNIQLCDHSLSTDCLMNTSAYSIIHWNSPKKLNTDYNKAHFFRELHYMFMEYDGAHLRQSLIYCEHFVESKLLTPTANSEKCEYNSKKPFRTHLYFYGLPRNTTDPYDVTLVSQMSMDRLYMLEGILQHWVGPISLAVYASDAESWKFLDYVRKLKPTWKKWNLCVHLIYKENERLYPVNYLRNVALNESNTPFVFLSDFDFTPTPTLYSYLKEAVKVLKLKTIKRALVVPAFESQEYKLSFPQDKETLLNHISNNKIKPFRVNVWKRGHQATNYDKWYIADRPYKVNWMADYEPYVVVSRNVSRYDERFKGFGWNKVSHTILLDAEGYEFVVVPHGYTIHLPHSPSIDILNYRSSKKYRNCQEELKQKFVSELIKKYGLAAKKYSNS